MICACDISLLSPHKIGQSLGEMNKGRRWNQGFARMRANPKLKGTMLFVILDLNDHDDRTVITVIPNLYSLKHTKESIRLTGKTSATVLFYCRMNLDTTSHGANFLLILGFTYYYT
jgi:hypothetical protein